MSAPPALWAAALVHNQDTGFPHPGAVPPEAGVGEGGGPFTGVLGLFSLDATDLHCIPVQALRHVTQHRTLGRADKLVVQGDVLGHRNLPLGCRV